MIDKKIIPALSFPIGAFGNHLRWLILLDEQYQFDIKLVDPESRGLYRTPDYINTCESYSFRSIESKLLFVNNYVYPENRTWHNWLVFEWKYRHLLQEIFPIEHAFDYEIENPTDKHLFGLLQLFKI